MLRNEILNFITLLLTSDAGVSSSLMLLNTKYVQCLQEVRFKFSLLNEIYMNQSKYNTQFSTKVIFVNQWNFFHT